MLHVPTETHFQQRIAELERDLKEARELFEEACTYQVSCEHGDPEEFCPPWIKLDLWLAQHGALAELDSDEGMIKHCGQ